MKNKINNISNNSANTAQKSIQKKKANIESKDPKSNIKISKKEISKKPNNLNSYIDINNIIKNTNDNADHTIENIIIGIDPGLHKMGVGIIKYHYSEKDNKSKVNISISKNQKKSKKPSLQLNSKYNPELRHINNKPNYIAHHLCLTKPTHDLEKRIHSLYSQLTELIRQYKPTMMVIEEIFAGVNRNTIIKLSMARTIPILCAAEHNIELLHLPTRMVKQYITGQGNAEKDLVAKQVCNLLGVDFIDNLDATDALACALCSMYY